MPQFDFFCWVSQVFWTSFFFILFFFFYLKFFIVNYYNSNFIKYQLIKEVTNLKKFKVNKNILYKKLFLNSFSNFLKNKNS
jgi:hypothetical protein